LNLLVEDNLKDLHATSDKENIQTFNDLGGRLPIQESIAENPNNRLTSAGQRDNCFMVKDLNTRVRKLCTNTVNKEQGYAANRMLTNNPFEEVINMVIVSNPDISILPTLVKPLKNEYAPEKSAETLKPRVNNAHTMSSDDYFVQASADEYDEISLTKIQPCAWNSKVQQFQSKISKQKRYEHENELFNGESSQSMREDRQNSLAMMNDCTFFAEMDRCMADSDLDEFAPQGVDEVSRKKELSPICYEHSLSVGNLLRTQDSTMYSKNSGAVMINKALELYKTKYDCPKSIPKRDCNDSFINLEEQLCNTFTNVRRGSILVVEEMPQNLDNPMTIGDVGFSQSKMEMSGRLINSPHFQATSFENEVLAKSKKAHKNQKVEVDVERFDVVLPSNTFSPESYPSKDGSACSLGKCEIGKQNYSFQNPSIEEMSYEQNPLFYENEDSSSNQPDKSTTPEQTPPSIPVINREVRSSYKSPSTPYKISEINKKGLNGAAFDGMIENREKYKLCTSKRLSKEVSKWTVHDVEHWILGLNTEVRHYAEYFKARQIDGERLTVLTEYDFLRFIPHRAHRYVVMNALREICPSSGELCFEFESGSVQRYQLKELIKIGKFSTTHRALDLGHSKRVCEVKLISYDKTINLLPHPGIAAKEVALKEWLAKSSSMKHENMIAYYDHFTDKIYGGTLYKYVLVREHHQLNLELLVNNNVSLGEVISRRILHQIVSLLSFFRAKKIGHFDLRPVNFLVESEKWDIRLTEWSSFKQFTQKSTESEGAEELDYRGIYTAPEIYNNQEYGLVADSWSLGVVLFGLITGKVLFSSRNKFDPVYSALKQDSFNAFCESLKERVSCSLMGTTESVIFNLVKYKASERLDIVDVKDHIYYDGVLPTDEEYTSAMSIAFEQCYKRDKY